MVGLEDLKRNTSLALVLLLIPLSCFALGGVTFEIQGGLVLFTGLILGWRFFRQESSSFSFPGAVFLLLSLLTALQALPLPVECVALFSPGRVALMEDIFELLPQVERSFSLSFDSGASGQESLKFFLYGLLAVLAEPLGRRLGARVVCLTIVGTALGLSGVNLMHRALDAHKIYGFIDTSIPAATNRMGPLLNPNNVAGYYLLGGFCALGLARSRRQWAHRTFILCAAWLFMLIPFTGSRAGTGALLIGGAIYWFLGLRSRGADRLSGVAKLLVAGSALTGVVLMNTLSHQVNLFSRDLSKLEFQRAVLPLIRDHAYVGIGRGSFESVFYSYYPGSSTEVFVYPENILLQWVSEWGLPVALLAGGALLWLYRPSVLGVYRSNLSRACFAGVGAWLAQNLLDVASEVPAFPVAIVILLGSFRGEFASRSNSPLGRRKAWFPLLIVGVAVLSGSVIVLSESTKNVMKDRARVHSLVQEGKSKEAIALTESALLRHPAEPYFFRMRAALGSEKGESWRETVRWLAASLKRCPTCGRTHLLLAQSLASRVPHQALLELKIALTHSPYLAKPAVDIAWGISQRGDQLSKILPSGKNRSRVAFELLAKSSLPTVQIPILRKALEGNSSNNMTRGRLIDAFVAANTAQMTQGEKSALCGGGCLKQAEKELETLRSNTSEHDSIRVLAEGGVYLSTLQFEEAHQHFSKTCSQLHVGYGRCASMWIQAGQSSGLRTLLEVGHLLPATCPTTSECSRAYLRLAAAYRTFGEVRQEIRWLKRACIQLPSVRSLNLLIKRGGDAGDLQAGAWAKSRLRTLQDAGQRAN